jgi:hypothetical protein
LDVVPIVGKNTCEKVGLILRLAEAKVEVPVQDEFPELFNRLGCLKGYEYDIL